MKAIGTDSAVESVRAAQGLPSRQGEGAERRHQWDIKGPDGPLTYQVKVAMESAPRQETRIPRVTLPAALPDFLRIITGKLNGQQAFFTGKLKLSGDMMFAVTQENWFDKNFGG